MPGEKKRIKLPDGSMLFLNQNTTVQLAENRHLDLKHGELFLQATPAKTADNWFVVQTPQRSVKALGTMFAVSPPKTRALVFLSRKARSKSPA